MQMKDEYSSPSAEEIILAQNAALCINASGTEDLSEDFFEID